MDTFRPFELSAEDFHIQTYRSLLESLMTEKEAEHLLEEVAKVEEDSPGAAGQTHILSLRDASEALFSAGSITFEGEGVECRVEKGVSGVTVVESSVGASSITSDLQTDSVEAVEESHSAHPPRLREVDEMKQSI